MSFKKITTNAKTTKLPEKNEDATLCGGTFKKNSYTKRQPAQREVASAGGNSGDIAPIVSIQF
jgi:hypothetical protein